MHFLVPSASQIYKFYHNVIYITRINSIQYYVQYYVGALRDDPPATPEAPAQP
ncbi:hypothetical protein COPEUT_00772 [Coprococcus eutactus ATCC 27759]|nr:hypothetical protein COPEUT_00772 [Coprococcus eutactus ATCC 27759]